MQPMTCFNLLFITSDNSLYMLCFILYNNANASRIITKPNASLAPVSKIIK